MRSPSKRALTLFLCAALLLTLRLTVPARAADVIFTSVNDTVLPLTSDSMPTWSGGTLYVPYTVFDSSVTGISLGLYCNYNRSSGTVMLISLSQILTFDINNGTCVDDITKQTYSAKAIIRHGKPYVPANMVCNFFHLTSSYTALNDGDLVRIKSSRAILSDAKFIDAAGSLISSRLREYNQSLEPEPTQPVPSVPGNTVPDPSSSSAPATPSSPSTTTPATPSKPNKPPATTTPEPEKPQEEQPEEPVVEVPTFLGFRCTTREEIVSFLDMLSGTGTCGAFFLPPQLLESETDLVRRILGTGHSLGIYAPGETEEETRVLLGQGQQLLEQSTHTRATLAMVPRDFRAAMENEGWVCWQETLTVHPDDSTSTSNAVTNAISRLSSWTYNTYMTLEGSGTSRILPSLLQRLEENHFIVTLPLEIYL